MIEFILKSILFFYILGFSVSLIMRIPLMLSGMFWMSIRAAICWPLEIYHILMGAK